MKILAFETSCDDTALAIVENGVKVLASVKVSQVEHNQYGGVVPEIAARLHSENWRGALEKCLNLAKISLDEIDALAVTQGPGLQTSLLTGTTTASFLSLFWQKPLIPVHHTLGHISSVFLDAPEFYQKNFPVLVLTVSGGHTEFFLQKSFTEIKKLGQTLDDAAGEAFDKVAKMLGLGYPGGPIVSNWAKKGNREKYAFPIPNLGKNSLDFSFSGVKAAVYRQIEMEKNQENFAGFSETFIADVCASFEETVWKIFAKKITVALNQNPNAKALHFVGGVSANKYLRENLAKFLANLGVDFRITTNFEYCTDNAAMIASAAYWLYQKNPEIAKIQFVDANSRLKF